MQRGPMNVFVVDWVGGSGPPYTQAVANIRLVGAIVGRFIQILNVSGSSSASRASCCVVGRVLCVMCYWSCIALKLLCPA